MTSHQKVIKVFLDRHQITDKIADQPGVIPVTIQKVLGKKASRKGKGQRFIGCAVKERITSYTTQKGGLLVRLDQPGQRRIPLFVEPACLSSIFRFPEYSNVVHENGEFFIYRVKKEGRCRFK